jgi:hypothetical protein
MLQLAERWHQDLIDTLTRKAHDYATDDDVLSNFKRISKICDLMCIDARTKEGYAILMVILKIDRLCNLLFRRDGTAENEPVDDSFRDAAGYLVLARSIVNESE